LPSKTNIELNNGNLGKVWDVLTTVIKMDDKVERMADTIKGQQMRIEDLTLRVVRLETALEIALPSQKPKTSTKNILK
jgi:hypothetical protein